MRKTHIMPLGWLGFCIVALLFFICGTMVGNIDEKPGESKKIPAAKRDITTREIIKLAEPYKNISISDVPSGDQDRIGKLDVVVTYVGKKSASGFIRFPKEDESEEKIKKAISDAKYIAMKKEQLRQ